MIEQDTIKLLRECDAGIKMGIDSIDDVLDHVSSPEMRSQLSRCRQEHASLQGKIQAALNRFQDQGKEPNPIAKGMSWMKTNWKLNMDGSDRTVAGLMIDGCDMGIKSLSRYLNQYQAADKDSQALARDLIRLEEDLAQALRPYL